MKVLAAGDAYMPSRFFAQAFAALEEANEIAYLDLEQDRWYVGSSPSEAKLREWLGSPLQLARRMEGVEVLVVHGAPVSEEVLDASRDLRLVCCARGGPVNIDIEAVTDRQLPLVYAPGRNAQAVADLTLCFLIMLARRLPRARLYLEDGNHVHDNWQGGGFIGRDLRGQTLGLIGCGRVGQRVAAHAQGFGMLVLAYDPYREADGVRQVSTLEELLDRSDFVSLHARATPENERLIDASALSIMKPGACLINTAREHLVDEDALDAALESGHLGGAALDLFARGVPGRPSRLLRHENVVLTPHIGGATPLINVLNGVAAPA